MTYFIIDTETTGLRGQVVEIAICDNNENVVFHSYVKPTETMENSARQINRVKDTDLYGAPDFIEVAEKIQNIVGDSPVFAFNAAYDKQVCVNSIIRSVAVTSGRVVILPGWIAQDWRCVMLAYATYFGEVTKYGYKWQKLKTAAENEKVSFSGIDLHSATGDAILTARLLKKDWTKKLKNVSRETQKIA